jgi:hypothetical protein
MLSVDNPYQPPVPTIETMSQAQHENQIDYVEMSVKDIAAAKTIL